MPNTLAQQQVVVWVELVPVQPDNVLLEAKMYTGARTSAIDTHYIQRYEKA